jgi:hypothetical protein
MKHIFIIMLAFLTLNAFAQPHRRGGVVSNFAFQGMLSNLNSKPDDAQKLEMAKKIVNENKLLSDQVKKIAELFGNDYSRLEFAQLAYDNTVDKDNYYEVYNSFSYFSSVFRLHDYVSQKRGGTKVIPVEEVKVMGFPSYDYPDYRKYFGKIGCTNIISDNDFTSLAEKVFNEPNEDKKLALANNISYSSCLQTAQAMKVASLLQNEKSRLDFLQKARPKVFDPDNYKYAMQVFNSENFKKEFSDFIGGTVVENNTNNIPTCEVSQKELTDIKNQINRQSFNNTKLNIAKENIKSKKCFKTSQIIEIINLLTYSDAKMEIAKFSYDYTTDTENYVKIADSFSFSTDKDAFLNFLKTKK